jgi:aldose 1-epimerase
MVASVVRIEAEELGTDIIRLLYGGTRLDIAPALGFCAVSWQVDEIERLALPLPLREFAKQPKTGGVPLLYPFANRLRGDRCLWRGTALDVSGVPGLKRDANRLPIHGSLVRFGAWTSIRTATAPAALAEATLEWDDRLPFFAAYPFVHRLTIRYELAPNTLRVVTRVEPKGGAMPIAFGWHPYLAFPTAARRETLLQLPDREHIELDSLMLPARDRGHLVVTARHPKGTCTLSGHVFDDLFRVSPQARAAVHPPLGGVRVELESGYSYLQVYAPEDSGFVCLEPMTAPGAALSDALDLAEASLEAPFEAVFSLHVG